MDFQTGLLCLGLVVASGIALFLILMFGTRSQSYEEVVAANRKLAVQRSLLDDSAKQKKLQQQQTKKNKKAGKKVKEKQAKEQAATSNSEVESEAPAESGVEDESSSQHPRGHVEFVEPTVIVTPEEPIKPSKNKKKSKESKVKPILINKDDPSCISDISNPPSPTATESMNHFEQIHPKDEFELLHSSLGEKEKNEPASKNSKEAKNSKSGKSNKASNKQEKEKVVKNENVMPTEPPKEQRKAKKSPAVSDDSSSNEKSAEDTSAASPPVNFSQPGDLTTDKILKEAYPLETPIAATNNTNVSNDIQQTKNSVQSNNAAPQNQTKIKKKKNELAQYQQLITCPEGVNVNILVQLLGEAPLSRSEIQILTDCLLNKQNGPLPEHSEWSEGPKDPLQKLKKQLAEKEKALIAEQEATQAVQAKLKELRTSLNAERSRCSQITQEKDDGIITLRNDISGLQSCIQKGRDENNTLRQQVIQLQSKITAESELTAQRTQLDMHIQVLSEEKAALLAENAKLHETCNANANQLHDAHEHMRRLEEYRHLYENSEAQKASLAGSEQLLQQEILTIKEQLNAKSKALAEAQAETSRHTSNSQQQLIKSEQQYEELNRQNQQLMTEINKLKTEKENISLTVTELKEKIAAQPTSNGTTSPDKDDSESIKEAVAAACSELEKKHNQQLDNLQRQIETHSDKNNELREKNWKVMEALTAAEKKIQQYSAQKASDDSSVREAITKACSEEQKKSKDILLRLFPQISAEGSSHQEWVENFLQKANDALSVANSAPVSSSKDEDTERTKELELENEKLRIAANKYKQVIEDMDVTLSRLQDNATEVDKKWEMQVAEKQREVDDLKKNSILKMENEIESLKHTLENERVIRRDLESVEHNPLSAKANKTNLPGMADVERLSEENARLRETIERLQSASQSQNGPTQLPPISTFDRKAGKKRRSIAGWLRRKITFKRKKTKEMRAVDQRKSPHAEERREDGDQQERSECSLDERSSNSLFLNAGSKTL